MFLEIKEIIDDAPYTKYINPKQVVSIQPLIRNGKLVVPEKTIIILPNDKVEVFGTAASWLKTVKQEILNNEPLI